MSHSVISGRESQFFLCYNVICVCLSDHLSQLILLVFSGFYNPCDRERNDFRLTQDRRIADIAAFEVQDPDSDTLHFDFIDYQAIL